MSSVWRSPNVSIKSRLHIPAAQLIYTIGAQIPGATATNNDIGSAERYHQDVVITNTMMGPAPPQWLAQLMAAPPPWIAQFIANVNQNLANVNQTLVSVNQTLACLEAGQANARISRLNKLEMERNNGLIAYRAKRKVVSHLFLALDHCLTHPAGCGRRYPTRQCCPECGHCSLSCPTSGSRGWDCDCTNNQS